MVLLNPAIASAEAFRVILDAMARPGRISNLGDVQDMLPLVNSTWTVLLTLCDHATGVFLPADYAASSVISALQFHAGARIVADPAQAAFVLAKASDATALLAACDMGSPEYPDRSATLIIQCNELNHNGVTLSGPGIQTTQGFGAVGMDAGFWQALSERRQYYPRGTDLFFTAPGQISAIPRSTRIEVR
ncbi:MAG: phosphonate C-P lyase system protein PhnH [Aestuariivirgaceae bacterium]|nr:phosphonate C-P lyase system protein PhnH [Aestuariivirgaceae bacterium]